ncbi:hypothetical protein, partial [Thiolapillus sp.]|uniref:hypothetical protein n=1 Tax=Thiolapillus sp. TaxID=2017437 RepID=UPI003AF6694D
EGWRGAFQMMRRTGIINAEQQQILDDAYQRGAPLRKEVEHKRVFGLVIDFGTSQSPKSTRPLTTYLCPSRPGHQALRNNFASSLLLRTCLPMTGRRVRRPTLFSLWRKARRENSAASRLLGSTSLRFALHGWQRWMRANGRAAVVDSFDWNNRQAQVWGFQYYMEKKSRPRGAV